MLPLPYYPGRAEPVKSAYGVGSADLRLLTEPAQKFRSSQLSGAGTRVARTAGPLTFNTHLPSRGTKHCPSRLFLRPATSTYGRVHLSSSRKVGPMRVHASRKAPGTEQTRHTTQMPQQTRYQHRAVSVPQQAEPAPGQRSAVHNVLRSSGQPLVAPLKEEMQARLGADFSQVRVHTDATARASAAELGARAYTVGSHIVIGDGGADRHVLAHELTHVIQQREGPVAGTDHGNGLKVSNPSDRYEREAAANAARAMSAPTPGPSTGHASTRPDSASAAGQGPAIQRDIPPGDLDIDPNHPNGWLEHQNTLHDDSGSYMLAELHPGHLGGGTPVGGSRPNWWPPGGTKGALNTTEDFFTNYMVQGHLLNEKLGGDNERKNLAPLSQTGNANHNHAAESQIKKELVNGNIIKYEVTVKYDISGEDLLGRDATNCPACPAIVNDININYHSKIAEHFSADYAVYDPAVYDPAHPNRRKWKHGEAWYVDSRRK